MKKDGRVYRENVQEMICRRLQEIGELNDRAQLSGGDVIG